MSDTEASADIPTPVEMANRMLDRAREQHPHDPLLPSLETLRDELVEQVKVYNQLETRLAQALLTIDAQASRLQSAADRIAQLEAELRWVDEQGAGIEP